MEKKGSGVELTNFSHDHWKQLLKAWSTGKTLKGQVIYGQHLMQRLRTTYLITYHLTLNPTRPTKSERVGRSDNSDKRCACDGSWWCILSISQNCAPLEKRENQHSETNQFFPRSREVAVGGLVSKGNMGRLGQQGKREKTWSNVGIN